MLVPGLVLAEHERAHCRTERQRQEQRDGGGGGDRYRELAIELAGDAADERRRDEDGQQHQGDGDERHPHLVHGDARGLERAQALLQLALDVLHHDDGVVDDDADRQHQAEQRQHVEREAERLHHRARADQRDGNGNDRDERGAPCLEEQEHDQHDQDGRFENGNIELADRDLDELGWVVGQAVLESLGKALRHLLDGVLDALGGAHGVGAGLLVDDDDDRRILVGVALRRVAQRAELDPADVLDPHDAAVGPHLDDDVLELVGLPEAPLHLQRDLEGVVVVDRRLAERAPCHLHVLRPQGVEHLLRGEPACGDPLGIEPDAHGILAHAEQEHVGDTVKPHQLVADVEQAVVGDVDLVVGLVGRDQMDRQQQVGRALAHGQAIAAHLVRQAALGGTDPVLHEHLGLVDVGADIERDGERNVAVAGRLRGHVDHALDAVHLLLDRRGNGVGDRLRAGAGIAGRHADGGGRDLRQLVDAEAGVADGADDGDDQRHHDREDRTHDEKTADPHRLRVLGSRGMALSRVIPAPSPPALRPAPRTRSGPRAWAPP